MDENKIEIVTTKALEKVIQVIKPALIAEEAKMSYPDLMAKIQRAPNRGAFRIFTEDDIERLNKAIVRIGMRLQKIQIEYVAPKYGAENAETKNQLQILKDFFQPTYFHKQKFNRTTDWFYKRIRPFSRETKNYYFKEEEILTINLAIKEASNLLLSIKLI